MRGEEPLRVTFDFVLSDFTGRVRVGDVHVAADPSSGEVAVAKGRDVHVFNTYGMEVFHFRNPMGFGTVLDLAIRPDGGFLTLAYDLAAPGDRPRFAIHRHDFRGRPEGELALSPFPRPFDGILPNRMIRTPEGLLLASTAQLLAVFLDADGAFLRGLELAPILEIEESRRDTVDLTGVAVDAEGNLLLTTAVLFRAWVVSPQGRIVATWGDSGSAPGSFGNIAGIARDAAGRTYVADKIRGVVLVFDEDYRFVTELTGLPSPAGRFGVPTGVYAGAPGKLYVTQVGRRGVWVYDVSPAAIGEEKHPDRP